MKFNELSFQEKAKSGFTHKVIISYAQGDFTAAATTQTYTLKSACPIGTIIQGAAYKAPTLVLGGAISAVTLQVGKTGTTNGYITATSVFTGGTAYKAGDGALFNQAGGDALVAATDLVAVITTTTANVSVATAGEIHIFLKLVDLTVL